MITLGPDTPRGLSLRAQIVCGGLLLGLVYVILQAARVW